MLQNLRHKKYLFGIIACVIGIICVRIFESELFYDPLLQYFRMDFSQRPLPQMNNGLLAVNLVFRFMLNSLFSLGIIYFLFASRSLLRFVTILYGCFFGLLFLAFFIALLNFPEQKMGLFYIRRFLIQPLLLLLFLPALYLQEKASKK